MKFVGLVAITPAEYEEKIKQVAKEMGADGATIIQARGSSSGEKKSFFSITFEGNQIVLLYIIEEKLARKVLRAIQYETQNNETTCLGFTMPISTVIGLDKELLGKFEDAIKHEINI